MSIALIAALSIAQTPTRALTYPIVGTGQTICTNEDKVISPPKRGEPFFGQDPQSGGTPPSYKALGDGTIEDQVTGLIWIQDPGPKVSWSRARAGASACRIGGFSDWRLPSIKELYSLIDFSGVDIDPMGGQGSSRPFINSSVFKFRYGDTTKERIIDAQYWSSTTYTSVTMGREKTAFGVNFADGRIKGYPSHPTMRREGLAEMTGFALYVRGSQSYGKNAFKLGPEGTVLDEATGLMWSRLDSGSPLGWKEALAYAQRSKLAGFDDWRVPTAKELQSIVDYSRSPAATKSPALDPVFQATKLKVEGGREDWGFYWTSTTHQSQRFGVQEAVYICFGEALGWFRGPQGGEPRLLDVHGAGAQRCEWKIDYSADAPQGFGPQGDVVRGRHLVRLVRRL